MTQILKGKFPAQSLKDWIKKEAKHLKSNNIVPSMGIIRIGNRQDDISYEKSIVKNCEDVGIRAQVFEVDPNIKSEEFYNLVRNVNSRPDVHGILIFRPLPAPFDIDYAKHLLDPYKDIDCINPANLLKVFEGDEDGFFPCTPEAVVEMLKHDKISLEGARVVIINRSMVVGKPLAMMFLKEGATVTICHSKTRNLAEVTSSADIVVTAVGKPLFFGKEYFNSNAVVIDVGINGTEDGQICGDVNYEEVYGNVQKITPVPGGVGSLTTTILLKHVIEACKKQVFLTNPVKNNSSRSTAI